MVEIDGPAAHPLEQMGLDAARDNAAVLRGYDVLRIDVARLTAPCRRAVEVITLLWRNGWTGMPVPCGRRCPVAALIRARLMIRESSTPPAGPKLTGS